MQTVQKDISPTLPNHREAFRMGGCRHRGEGKGVGIAQCTSHLAAA